MTENERELINLCKTPQVAELMLKAMLCGLAYGNTFIEATKGCMERGDVNELIEIVNRESQALA